MHIPPATEGITSRALSNRISTTKLRLASDRLAKADAPDDFRDAQSASHTLYAKQ